MPISHEGVWAEVAGMLSVAAEAREYATKLGKKQTAIDDDVAELFQTWTGPASTSYGKEWKSVKASSDELIADLVKIANLVENAAWSYQEQDHGNAETFRNVQSATGNATGSDLDSTELNL